MNSEKDIKLQPRRATSRQHGPQEENYNSSKQLIVVQEEHPEGPPDFSSNQVPIMKVTKHKSILLLGEDEEEEEEENSNVFAMGTLLSFKKLEAALPDTVVFQGKFKGAFERTDEGEYYFQGTITNIKFFESDPFQADTEMPELETFNGFFKGYFIEKDTELHQQLDDAPHYAVDPQIQRKSEKKEYHVPVMVRIELRKISKINLQNSSAEIAAVLHIAIRLNEEVLGRIYDKDEDKFQEKHKLCIDFHLGKPLLLPFYDPTDFEDELDTDDETLYEWDDVWEGIDYQVEWEPEEMVMRYRIQMNYKAEIDNSHGIFWAPFSLSVLKIIIDFHSVDVKDYKICFNCCDLTDFDEAAPYSPYTQFSDLPLEKHIDRLSKINTSLFLDQGEYMLATNRLALFPYHRRILKNKNCISSDYAQTLGLSQRSKQLTEPDVKSIKESYEHFNQRERHFKFSAERWEFVHIEIPIFKYPVIDIIRIFVPIILLSAISMTIFEQENAMDSGGFTELAKRIASGCSIMLAYIALIPLIRRNLPPTPSVTLVEILIYISTIPNFLAIISVLTTSFTDYQDFFDNYKPFLDPLFSFSFAICLFSALTLVIVMIIYGCKDFKIPFIVHSLKPSPMKNLRSPVCLKYFRNVSKMRKEEFRIEQIPFEQEKDFGSRIEQSAQLSKIQSIKVSADIEDSATQLAERFSVVRSMTERLEKTAYSTEQAISLADAIITAVLELENVETQEEKKAVQQFLDNHGQKLYKDDELYYHQFVSKFKEAASKKEEEEKKGKKKEKEKEKGKEKRRLKPESLSRIYNLIANFKKREVVNEKYQNEFKVPCLKTYRYKVLSEAELEEVVKLDGVAEKVLSLGDELNFRFNSILQETDNMANLLSKCFNEYHSHIQNLKYDLKRQEIYTVAKISRQACDSHDNGVFILLVYFVTACANLEKNKKKSVKLIQQKMEKALNIIQAKYPAGQGLTKEQQKHRTALKNLNFPLKNDNKKVKFKHPAEPLGPDDKQTQLERIIMKYAKIAKHNKPHFEELVRKTCLNLCLQTNIDLKYNPDNPNEKALTRIKEKMLFKKDGTAQKPSWNTLTETIKGEAKSYRQQVSKLLAGKTKIQFKISDMVRGKCTFISIPDIIETIDKIKRFVAQDEQRRFRITEIESRFTNKVPISDVTLKIAINEEIIAELQLTVQTNAPAYNFAHKIYELQRTKVFSKVKIVHNYFEEFKQDFREVCKRSLELAKNAVDMMPEQDHMCLEKMDKRTYINAKEEKEVKKKADLFSQERKRAAVINKHSIIIHEYFDLSQVQRLQLKDALKRALQKQYEYEERTQYVPRFSIAGDQKLQDLILPLFNKQMGHWYQTLGKAINKVLTSEAHSLALKATILNYFLAGFSISKQAHKMRQFFPTYRQIAKRDRSYGDNQFKVGKQFMQFYLKYIFSIDNPFVHPYSSYNAKVHLKVLQTQQLSLGQQYESDPVLLLVKRVVQTVVVSEGSPERIDFLRHVIEGYFILRKKYNRQICDQFEHFYIWLMQIFKQNQQIDTGIVSSLVKLMGAQTLLQKGQYNVAQDLLQQAKKVFKQKEENAKFLEAQLLLTEVLSQNQQKTIEEVQDFYQANKEKAKNLGIEMRGEAIANAEWRIAKYLWKKANKDEKENVVNHICCAVSESSRSEGEEFILKWKAVDELMVQESQQIKEKFRKGLEIKPNAAIEYINLSYNNIGAQGCEHLAKADWKNLATLILGNSDCNQVFNYIGDKGCEHLAKAEWKNLATLILGGNKIENQGCRHLAKAKWKNLATLDLGGNKIRDQGCEHLAKAEWKNLSTLNLINNPIKKDSYGRLSSLFSQENLYILWEQNSSTSSNCCPF